MMPTCLVASPNAFLTHPAYEWGIEFQLHYHVSVAKALETFGWDWDFDGWRRMCDVTNAKVGATTWLQYKVIYATKAL